MVSFPVYSRQTRPYVFFTLVAGGALPFGFARDFETLASVIEPAAARVARKMTQR